MSIKKTLIYILSAIIGFIVLPVICSFSLSGELFDFDFSSLSAANRFIMACVTIIFTIAAVLVAKQATENIK